MKEYKVKEVADLLGKHEETIKRWIRSGKFPNAFRNSDKEGWRIIESDLLKLNKVTPVSEVEEEIDVKPEVNETELVKLAYQAVTLTSPADEMLSILSLLGIKRTLEILLIMQQSPSKVRNPDGFIKKAIRENWSPSTTPIKLSSKPGKRLYELTQKDFESSVFNHKNIPSLPLYNWLEED